jgi:hypothetical protein
MEGSQEEERLTTARALAATCAAECRVPLVPCASPSCEHSPGLRRDFLSSKESPGQKGHDKGQKKKRAWHEWTRGIGRGVGMRCHAWLPSGCHAWMPRPVACCMHACMHVMHGMHAPIIARGGAESRKRSRGRRGKKRTQKRRTQKRRIQKNRDDHRNTKETNPRNTKRVKQTKA